MNALLSCFLIVFDVFSMKKCGGCEFFVKWRNDKISDFCEILDTRVTSDSKACSKFKGLSKVEKMRNENRWSDWEPEGLDEAQ